MIMNRNKLAVVVAAAISIGWCSAAAADRSIAVALAGGQNTMYAPFLVAVGGGFFEKRGIAVEQQPFASGSQSFAAFAGGSAQFCICGPTQVLSASDGGLDAVAVFNQYLGGNVIFMAPKALEQEKGTDLANFDGATWAYTAEGSTSQAFMIRAAQAAGLDWSNQRGIAIGGVAAYIPTLQERRADLVTTDPMSGAKAVALGIAYPVFNTNDPALVEPIWGRQIGQTLITTRVFIEQNEELVQDVADAMREALTVVQQNVDSPDRIFELMPAEYQEANPDFAEQWELIKFAFVSDGSFTDTEIEDTVAFALSVGTLKPFESADFNPRDLFINTFAERAISKFPGAK
jgi:ABC-type nitrate/sulfonate/bicarbonate transport system substrate-binding protein